MLEYSGGGVPMLGLVLLPRRACRDRDSGILKIKLKFSMEFMRMGSNLHKKLRRLTLKLILLLLRQMRDIKSKSGPDTI